MIFPWYLSLEWVLSLLFFRRFLFQRMNGCEQLISEFAGEFKWFRSWLYYGCRVPFIPYMLIAVVKGFEHRQPKPEKRKKGRRFQLQMKLALLFFFRCETFDSMIFLLPEVGCLRKVMFSKPDKIVSEYVLLDTCLRLKNGWDGVLALKRNRRA